jgi:cytoskeletal protein CcmA (bactofilin family)
MLFRKLGLPAGAVRRSESSRLDHRSPATVIGQHTRFRGEARGRGALEVRGQMEGSLRVDDRVSIARDGRLSAEVSASEMIVEGYLEGEVRIHDRLVLRRSGSVHGHVESGRMEVEEGAILKGTVLRRVDPPAPGPGSQPPDVN